MKKLVFIVLFFSLIVCTVRTYSSEAVEQLNDPLIQELIKDAPDSRDFPGQSAVYLLMEEKDFVNKDGTGIYEIHIVIIILDNQAMSLGEVSIPYSQNDSTLKIESARTIRPDNTVVNVDLAGIREVAPYSGFPLYNVTRLKQFSMPAMEVGCVIEYKAVLTVFKPKMPGYFYSYWSFPPGFPILLAKFEIDLPEDMEIHYMGRKLPIEPEIVKTDENRKIYNWTARNVFIGGIYEQFLPPYDVVCPNLTFTSSKTWDEVAGWFYDMSEPQLEPNEVMKEQAASVVKRKGGDREKIMKELYNDVSTNIRYVAIPLKASGYKPHSVKDIYETKYGDCKDKSAYLISLYRLAGIDAHFALLRNRSTGPQITEFPVLSFNHCIVAVPKEDGGYIFLDPTLELNRFGYVPTEMRDVDIFVIKKDGYEFVKLPLDIDLISGTISTISMDIGDDYHMDINDRIEYKGDREIGTRLNYKYATRDAIRAFFEQGIHSMYTHAKLIDVNYADPEDLDKPFWDSTHYEVWDHIKEAGNLLIFDLPLFGFPGSMLNVIVSTEKRIYPLWFPGLTKDFTDVTITVPKNCSITYLPKNIEEDDRDTYKPV